MTPKPAPIDTKALRAKWGRPASEGRRANLNERREAESMLDEIDSLRAQLAEAKTRGYDDRRDAEVVAALAAEWDKARKWLADSQTKVRAAALADAAKASREHGLDNFAERILALAPLPPGFRVVEEEVIHSILGHIEASMQHTHGVDCRGFDDGDDLNSDGDCGCGLVSASKARAALAALEGAKP